VTVRGFAADHPAFIRFGRSNRSSIGVFPFAELARRQAYMESNAQVGKIAVRIPGCGSTVPSGSPLR